MTARSEEKFDKLRNLEEHRENLEKKIKNNEAPEGNCNLCAEVWCLSNITKEAILKALEKGDFDAVEQFTCDDFEDDESIPRDLRDPK